MSKAKVAPKAVKQKASERPDLTYVSLRLRGLARLIDCAVRPGGHADPIDENAAFFISTELEDVAAKLGAQ